MNPNTEIRKLRPAELYTLARILAASDSWKTLMAVVPKEGTENEPKFNTEHFVLIEQASGQQRKSGAEIFLEEWSTMGKQRPTLKTTLDLLIRVQLFRAADYIAVDLLQTQPPERPSDGPAARIDISDEEIAKLMNRTDSEFEMSKESSDSVLDGLHYPSQVSNQSSVERYQQEVEEQSSENNSHHETRRIELEVVEEISNLTIRPEETKPINSNLMQFSKSDVEVSENNDPNPVHCGNSNLMQFSSTVISNRNSMNSDKDFPLANGVCNTHLTGNDPVVPQRGNIPNGSSSNNVEKYCSEKITKEESIRVNGVQVQNTFETKESSNVEYGDGSSGDSTDFTNVELQSSELPTFVRDIGRGSSSMYREVKSSELPQFVLEITHQNSSQSGTTTDTESFGEPVSSNDSNSSNVSSNYLNNVTSPVDNNTESNIPVCVNWPSRGLENCELVSAELPQFVADLGHCRESDNSTRPIDGTDQSPRERYTSRVVVSKNISTYEYVGLNSQELPLVVSECNKMRSQFEERPIELESAELPQCVIELKNFMEK